MWKEAVLAFGVMSRNFEELREIAKILRDDSCFSGRYLNVDFRNLKPRSSPFCMSRHSIMYTSICNGTSDQ